MKRIIPLVAIMSILISLFALPVGAEKIPDDEVYKFLPFVDEVFVVPEYRQVYDEFYGYTIPTDFTVNDDLFDFMLPFWNEFGDDTPEGFSYALVINGIEYLPVYQEDGNLYYGNPELTFGHEFRDQAYATNGYFNISFSYEYDNTLPFFAVFGDFMHFVCDDSLADGFTLSYHIFYEPKVEAVNYEDYTTGSVLSGGGSTIMVSFPSDWAATHVRFSDEKVGQGVIYYGSTFTYDRGGFGIDHHIQTYPFGWFFPVEKYYYHGKALYADNIPDGSTLTFTYTLRMKSENSWLYEPENPEFLFRVAHVAEPGVTTYIESGTYEVLKMKQTGGEFVMTVECSYTKDDLQFEAEYLAFCCGFDLGIDLSDSILEFSLDDIKLEISVESLAAMIMETQKTNKLLDEVKQQLAEQGKTLNEVLSGSSGMQQEADKITGDIANKVEQGNQLMDSLDAVQRPHVGGAVSLPTTVITGTATNFNTVVAHLWNNDLIYQMMSLAGMVMLASYILFGKKV